jgi:hypothetical protein
MRYAPLVLAVAISLPVTVSVPALAEDFPPGNEPFQVLSEGGATCGEFVQASPATQTMMADWVLGFLSGLNAGSAGKLRLVGRSYQTSDPVIVWLRNYCSSRALDGFVAAAFALRKAYIAHEAAQ